VYTRTYLPDGTHYIKVPCVSTWVEKLSLVKEVGIRYGDSVDDTVEENSSVFSQIRMRCSPPARACRQ